MSEQKDSFLNHLRLGMNHTVAHETPEEWASFLADHGFRAASFPADYTAPVHLIDAYVKEAAARDIQIAEVGVWTSPWNTDPQEAEKGKERCLEQLRLAEYIHARCCVNVSGAAGPDWAACYRENYAPALYEKNVEFIQYLIDTVKPQHTCYSLETMQWMVPWSVEQYVQVIRDVDRPAFKVHLDPFNLISDSYTYTHQKEVVDEAFDRLGGQIVSFHIKDVIMDPGLSVMIRETQIGTGSFDHKYYLEKIASLGDPDMPALIEHRPDPQDYLDAMEYLKKVAGGNN